MYRSLGEEQSRQPGGGLPAVMNPPVCVPHGPAGEAMHNRANPCELAPDGLPNACRLTIEAARGCGARATGERAQLAVAPAATARKATAAAGGREAGGSASETRAAGVASGRIKPRCLCVFIGQLGEAENNGAAKNKWQLGRQGHAPACRPGGICCACSLCRHRRECSPQVLPLVAQLLVALLKLCLPRPLSSHQRLQGLNAIRCRALLVLMQRPAGRQAAAGGVGEGQSRRQSYVD